MQVSRSHDVASIRPIIAPRRRRRSLAAMASALAVVTTVMLGACSGPGSGGEQGKASGSAAPAGETGGASLADGAKASDGGAAADGRAVTAAATVDPPADRARVFTGNIDVDVRDLPAARQRAEAAVAAAGGFLAKEELDNATGAATRTTATYRVPPDHFRTALAALAGLGKVRSERTATDDVSATVADVDSRLATLHASSDRLRGFLAKATDPNQIASLEGELTRREAEAASLEAQQRSLADQVAYSTIVATFQADGATPPVKQAEPVGFARGLSVGVDMAATAGRSLLAVAGFALPFLPLLLAAALLVRWGRRRSATARSVAPG